MNIYWVLPTCQTSVLFQMLEAKNERRPSHIMGCMGRREEASEQAVWLEAVGLRAEAWLRISWLPETTDGPRPWKKPGKTPRMRAEPAPVLGPGHC